MTTLATIPISDRVSVQQIAVRERDGSRGARWAVVTRECCGVEIIDWFDHKRSALRSAQRRKPC